MIRPVTIEAVTHTHTHTHTRGNLMNNKKINIYTIFMYFLRIKIYKYGVFLCQKTDKLEFV